MDFDFKIRLLGYYNFNNQNMNPESIHIEEADILAKLLDKSFAEFANDKNTTDIKLLEAFKGKGVFIFKDERNHLYAYSPSTHMARISDVEYNKKAINVVDLSYKKWFIPGELFEISVLRKSIFRDLSGNVFEYKENLISVNKSRNDYFVHFSDSSFAIKWFNAISIQDLRDLILHRWFYLQECESSAFCGDCDGWDYEGCDMDRCRGECDGCGGRRYKCNNSCFFYRNKACVEICLDPNLLEKELKPAFKYIEEISAPFYVNSSIPEELDSLYKDCLYVQKHKQNEVVEYFINRFDRLAKIVQYRLNANNIRKVQLIIRSSFNFKKHYLMPIDNVSITDNEDFLFWENHQELVIEGYDYNSDSYISKQSYSLLQKNKSNTKKMMCLLKEGTLKVIRLEKWASDDRWRLGYE